MRERVQHGSALTLALHVRVGALELLQVALRAGKVRPHLLNPGVEGAALLGPPEAAEELEKSALLTALPTGLSLGPIEFGLLAANRLLHAPNLIRSGRIGAGSKRGKLGFQPLAALVAAADRRAGRRIGGRRQWLLGSCRRKAGGKRQGCETARTD
ncbi:hypothetical protein [Pseudorhodoplanes sp.]|uniref:hypothetical protein n=1 Tax=Pseudorhodoplanes sp. TaxID=1934341 RepID=UPI002CED83B8|nr:hypothetical protein [Pseudorhodoplanes sp.]HWV41074.1 hypothetical protein [Pseudorhodoplanes sp.]